MRMMCIKGRQHPKHTGLVAGQVYEVSMVQHCCETRAYAEGSVWRRNVRLTCSKCGNVTRCFIGSNVPWGPDRFAPWKDQDVSIDEVKKLYEPDLLTIDS